MKKIILLALLIFLAMPNNASAIQGTQPTDTNAKVIDANPTMRQQLIFGFVDGLKSFDYAGNSPIAIRGYKEGKAVCKSYVFGIYKKGDCGIGDAMKNGGLKTLKYVDFKRGGWILASELVVKAYGD